MWLGLSGGMLPCPTALLILVVAFNPAINSPILGYATVLAFSTGMALVLTAIGAIVVRGRSTLSLASEKKLFSRINPRLELFAEMDAFILHGLKLLPYLGMILVIAVGALMVWWGIELAR
jgi:ABC-type nickel/cobalt efflux system permease component RcnA